MKRTLKDGILSSSASHPVWVCGLKPAIKSKMAILEKSHPVWVCGLKLYLGWLENLPTPVTPCMGVWIETAEARRQVRGCRSHPVWVCGLKLVVTIRLNYEVVSHPVWVCGLKLPEGMNDTHNLLSHPVWVCGLKLFFALNRDAPRGHTLYGCVD